MSGKNVVKLTHTGSFCPSLNCTWGREREREYFSYLEGDFGYFLAYFNCHWLVTSTHTHTRGMRQVKDETFLLTESSILSLSLSPTHKQARKLSMGCYLVKIQHEYLSERRHRAREKERKRQQSQQRKTHRNDHQWGPNGKTLGDWRGRERLVTSRSAGPVGGEVAAGKNRWQGQHQKWPDRSSVPNVDECPV